MRDCRRLDRDPASRGARADGRSRLPARYRRLHGPKRYPAAVPV